MKINNAERIAWKNMLARTTNTKRHDYERYGGRGITVCDRWVDSFKNFLEDMGERPVGMTLDRVDNDGNYEPDNCRWADIITQNVNQRTRKDNKSGYRGVSWDKSTSKWVPQIRCGDKKLYLGLFTDPIEAAYVRDQFAMQIHGSVIKLNLL
jgi:hypothetical protein